MEKQNFEKLPKWVQNKISQLNSEINYLNNKLSQFAGEKETNTFIRDGLDLKPLPKNSIIEFKTGDRLSNKVSAYISDNGFIYISSDSSIGEKMIMLPRASNSFYITFIK